MEIKLKNVADYDRHIVQSPDYEQTMKELKDNGWIFCFKNKSDNKIYFRTFQTDVLNSEMGDIISEISVIENEILFEIQTLLTEKYSEQLKQISDVVSQIDALFSLAAAAINHGLQCPTIRYDTKPYVSFQKGGFNILNDFNVSSSDPAELSELRCACIAGLNGSGKTSYIKLIGIIVYLAQIGSFVPAEK